jgi:hypothetical protein
MLYPAYQQHLPSIYFRFAEMMRTLTAPTISELLGMMHKDEYGRE